MNVRGSYPAAVALSLSPRPSWMLRGFQERTSCVRPSFQTPHVVTAAVVCLVSREMHRAATKTL